ncbi:MAG: hypothetical protein ACJ796_14540 [Gemmatimonadaceae bacterium]|jgi:hypothetical protein
MNFGGAGFGDLGLVLLGWAVPIGLMIWFVRTVSAMAGALREIADRLGTLERAVRESSDRRPT